MHAIARENLQHFLYAYKESPKEQGLRLLHDARKSQAQRREREYQRAVQSLRAAVVNHITHSDAPTWPSLAIFPRCFRNRIVGHLAQRIAPLPHHLHVPFTTSYCLNSLCDRIVLSYR
ncbi:hypothetical protein GCK32_007045, partial [Trichostrongylus colubriformis]